jgi:hypothetical protein
VSRETTSTAGIISTEAGRGEFRWKPNERSSGEWSRPSAPATAVPELTLVLAISLRQPRLSVRIGIPSPFEGGASIVDPAEASEPVLRQRP